MDLGQVFTLDVIADFMISLFSLDSDKSILDPCFGEGAFIDAAIRAGYKNIEGYELDKSLFVEFKRKENLLNLFNADFLSSETNKKYDGIVMNPPYIRHEKINDLEPYGITKECLSDEIYQPLSSTANLYMYFIVKAIHLLQDKGELVVIFPSSWLKSKNGMSFKEYLTSACQIIRQIHLSGKVFKGDALVDVIILHMKKSETSNHKQTVFQNVHVKDGVIVFEELEDTTDNLGFNIKLKEVASIRRGLTTGFNNMYINPPLTSKESEKFLKDIISTPKDIHGYSTKNAVLDSVLLLNTNDNIGAEIHSYLLSMKNKILKDEKPKTLYQRIERNDNSWYQLKNINCEGIIFNYFVRDKVRFILNDKSYLVRDNFYILQPKTNRLLLFALLNNFYTFYQLELLGKKYGGGLLKLQKYDIENLKFPDISHFSEVDKGSLKELSQSLVNTSSFKYIEEISKILANYSLVGYEQIKELYFLKKTNRLGGK